jgi:hypothetical protein
LPLWSFQGARRPPAIGRSFKTQQRATDILRSREAAACQSYRRGRRNF